LQTSLPQQYELMKRYLDICHQRQSHSDPKKGSTTSTAEYELQIFNQFADNNIFGENSTSLNNFQTSQTENLDEFFHSHNTNNYNIISSGGVNNSKSSFTHRNSCNTIHKANVSESQQRIYNEKTDADINYEMYNLKDAIFLDDIRLVNPSHQQETSYSSSNCESDSKAMEKRTNVNGALQRRKELDMMTEMRSQMNLHKQLLQKAQDQLNLPNTIAKDIDNTSHTNCKTDDLVVAPHPGNASNDVYHSYNNRSETMTSGYQCQSDCGRYNSEFRPQNYFKKGTDDDAVGSGITTTLNISESQIGSDVPTAWNNNTDDISLGDLFAFLENSDG